MHNSWTFLQGLKLGLHNLHIASHSLPPQNGEGETFSFHDPGLLVSPYISIPILNYLNVPWYRHSNSPIHGPCNGLVCIAFEKAVFLCNPALREFKLLPPLRFPWAYSSLPLQCGFGFDRITGDYKVIQIMDMCHITHDLPGAGFSLVLGENFVRFDLYSSASNSWKQIDAKVHNISYLPGYELFYNGAIHWNAIIASCCFPCILCFDVSTETFRQLDFHDNFCPFETDLRLMEFNDSLAVVRYSHRTIELCKTEIWVMKEYGVKESWTKQFVMAPYCDICPFLFLKNEFLLVESDDGKLAACAQFKGFQFYGDRHSTSAVFYEESLIPLNEIIASDR